MFTAPSCEDKAQRPAYSLIRHSPAFVVLAIVIADAAQLADPDLWNNLRAGQIILATRHVTLYDSFSYSAFGHLWRNHEWLSHVALAAAYGASGVFGLKMIKLLCAAATISLIALALAETGAPPRLQRVTLAFTALALLPQIQFRPQLATFVMLSLLLLMLARDTYRRVSRLWPLVPLFALWANLHGGYVAGVAAVAIYSGITALDELRRGRGWARGARLALLTAACIVATLANPDGVGIWRTVLNSIADPLVHTGLAEWRPLIDRIAFEYHAYPLGLIIYLLPLGMYVAFAISLFLAPDAEDIALAAIAVVFVAGAFISVRNMALAVVALTIPMAHHFAIIVNRRAASNRTSMAAISPGLDREDDSRFNPALAIGLAAVIVAATGLLSDRLAIDEHCPVGAVAFMRQHNLHGNVLSSYDWGNYLTWQISPRSKVFIDGRSDQLFPPRVIADYYDFYYASPRARTVLDGYPHDFVLVPPDSDGFTVVAKNPSWKMIYRDSDAALFARATSPAAQVPMRPVPDSSGPKFFP
jgi:hypothetical protein